MLPFSNISFGLINFSPSLPARSFMNLGDVMVRFDMNPIPSLLLLDDDVGIGVSGPFASRASVVIMDEGIGEGEPWPDPDPDPVENRRITPDNRFEKLGVVDFVLT